MTLHSDLNPENSYLQSQKFSELDVQTGHDPGEYIFLTTQCQYINYGPFNKFNSVLYTHSRFY